MNNGCQMGIYKYIRETWKNKSKEFLELNKQRLIDWRKEPATTRISKPTRLDRARSLGYKAKPGFIIIRQRVSSGGRMRETKRGGRRPKHRRLLKIVSKNYQQIAEERAASKFPNLEVLNSYWVAKDGKNYWYEIIMIDKSHPSIKTDKEVSWITQKQHTRRAFRGLTSAAKKSRGLRRKGIGAEKMRPSRRAKNRLAK